MLSMPLPKLLRANKIRHLIIQYKNRLHNLPPIFTENTFISYNSINSFIKSTKDLNDTTNKTREKIILSLINNLVPQNYFTLSNRWKQLNRNLNMYLTQLFKEISYDKYCALLLAGRGNHFDFKIMAYKNNVLIQSFNVEFKFGTATTDGLPQFVSPMKPSQYMSASYEEYYYENHLPIIFKDNDIGQFPDKETYLKQIHSSNPKCMELCKEKYKKDDVFKNLCNNESKKSIETFITNNELYHEKLTAYFLETQHDKYYMMYFKGRFYYEIIQLDDYRIVSIEKKPKKSLFTCITKSGVKMNILLRWKNDIGVAFPAFQINRVKPKQKDTKQKEPKQKKVKKTPVLEEPTPAPTPVLKQPTPVLEEPTPVLDEPTPVLEQPTPTPVLEQPTTPPKVKETKVKATKVKETKVKATKVKETKVKDTSVVDQPTQPKKKPSLAKKPKGITIHK